MCTVPEVDPEEAVGFGAAHETTTARFNPHGPAPSAISARRKHLTASMRADVFNSRRRRGGDEPAAAAAAAGGGGGKGAIDGAARG